MKRGGGGNGRELKVFKLVHKVFNWPAGAPRSPKGVATQALIIWGSATHPAQEAAVLIKSCCPYGEYPLGIPALVAARPRLNLLNSPLIRGLTARQGFY